MNQLLPNPKTHVITTFDGLNFFITKQQQMALVSLPSDKYIKIDGNAIKGSNISSVMPIGEFYYQNPSKKPDQARASGLDGGPDYKSIADEAKESAAKRTTKQLLHILPKLREFNAQSNRVSYSHMQAQKAIENELKARNVPTDSESEYSFEEIQEQGFMGIINSASENGVAAMLRGMDKFLSRNPNSPNAKLLRAKMVEALNKKRNEQNKTSEVRPA